MGTSDLGGAGRTGDSGRAGGGDRPAGAGRPAEGGHLVGAGRLAAFAALFAEESRAAMVLALLDGRAWTAGELARHARVAPSTATEHLGKLVAGGVLAEERQGRHRYVRLAGPGIAHLVEELAGLAGPDPQEAPRSLAAASAGRAMARGRTCYDHLAGRLGVAVTDALTARGLLRQDTGFALTERGLEWFAALGVPLPAQGRRPLTRACLDWTERRPHLAGRAGAALCAHALDADWCVRIGSARAVKVTPAGERALRQELGIEADALR